MAVAALTAAVVPTATNFCPRLCVTTKGVGSRRCCISRCWCSELGSNSSSLGGSRMAHASCHVGSQKQSLRKALIFPQAISDCSVAEDSWLYPYASGSVLGIILGGGAGSRLYPLTMKRAKPAVPIAANYRLIDIPVSNCINSNINKIYVLTQFNSASLNRHVSRAYASILGGYKNDVFVEMLPAQQTRECTEWFKGTADAVRKYLWLFEEHHASEYLVLAGDQLYRMDYQRFIQVHRETNADITIAALPMDEARATDFGLMKINDEGRIIEFAEKPTREGQRAMQVDTTVLGLDAQRAKDNPYIASMGIYVVRNEAMTSMLERDFPEANDFGSEVIPAATKMGMKVQAYLFDGYWEDIGTIEAFYNANMGIAKKPPEFSFFDRRSPIYTQPRHLPPSKLHDADIRNSVIGEGCVILVGTSEESYAAQRFLTNAKIYNSVVGLRLWVAEGAVIEETVHLGADFYETDLQRHELVATGEIPVGIGRNSVVKKAVVDKNSRIGENVKIVNKDHVQEAEREADGFVIRGGRVIICKDATIPHGTII